jgi:hypothetical protein
MGIRAKHPSEGEKNDGTEFRLETLLNREIVSSTLRLAKHFAPDRGISLTRESSCPTLDSLAFGLPECGAGFLKADEEFQAVEFAGVEEAARDRVSLEDVG